MLCERGIRTFETHTRYTLPLASVPYLRRKTHLPVVVDPVTEPVTRTWCPIWRRRSCGRR